MYKNDSELIIMAPLQIKPHLSIGNIYDLTILDFYSKALRFLGKKATLPFLWNINGNPLIKQMERMELETTSKNLDRFIASCVATIEGELRDYYLDFDFFIRDDQVSNQLKDLMDRSYKQKIKIGKVIINHCGQCGNVFGADPGIIICKYCGSKTKLAKRLTIYTKVNGSNINKRINTIKFIPDSAKLKLKNFISTLPNNYNLIIEKYRKNTLQYNGFTLDPRFVAIMLPAIINVSDYDKKTWIHGDVIKKFDYYSLCYLNSHDGPTTIISHGILLDKSRKKLRWQNLDLHKSFSIEKVHNKILRAYFLNYNVMKDRVFDAENLPKNVAGLLKIYVKIGRVLDKRNLDESRIDLIIHPELIKILQPFDRHVQDFRPDLAFNVLTEYTDWAWKYTKSNKLNFKEQDILRQMKNLFFGK